MHFYPLTRNIKNVSSSILLTLLLIAATPLQAETLPDQSAASLNESINNIALFICAAMVLFMQAGFALLESGLSRTKNSVNVIIKNYGDMCFGTLIFLIIGYGLMYGDNQTGYFGFSKFFLSDVPESEYIGVLFQAMFAATAVTICSGAMAERTNFHGYLIAASIIMGVIYPIYGSWVWNENGWLSNLGFHDYAGGTVVHSLGAWCALAGIIVLKPRFGRYGNEGEVHEIPGHNLTMVGLGGFILWFGWFGFNVGSGIGGDVDYGLITLNTHIGATAGAVSTVIFSVLLGRKTRAVMLINGVLAGLVSVTAGADVLTPITALFCGFIGGLVLVFSELLLIRLKIDDVVSAVSVHGFCGAWGTIAIALFNNNQLFNMDAIVPQLCGVGAAFIFAFPTSLVMFYILNALGILRTTTRDEQRGLDYSEHDEIAYPEFQQSRTHNG